MFGGHLDAKSKMAANYHLGFVEFLDFDECDTETRVIPLIPPILGLRIRFWCGNYVSVFVCWGVCVCVCVGGGGGGGHIDAKSKMTAKNNKYTPGTHWSPIRMMPARLSNALWYSIMFA